MIYFHTVTLSHCHTVTLSHCQTVTLPQCLTVTQSHYHTVMEQVVGYSVEGRQLLLTRLAARDVQAGPAPCAAPLVLVVCGAHARYGNVMPSAFLFRWDVG